MSFEVSDRTTTYVVVVCDGGVLCGRCDFLCYVCVVASAAAASNDRRCTNYYAGVRLTDHGGLRQRCADGGRILLRTQIRKNS